MPQTIQTLIDEIHLAFKGVKLGNGISWREAAVLDDYGTIAQRQAARALDESEDWTAIPFSFISDLKYQDVMPFIDATGLRFYLPAYMIYILKEYKHSNSLIVHSTIYTLTRKSTVLELKVILNEAQQQAIIHFLECCLILGDDYLDLHKVAERLEAYWKSPLDTQSPEIY